jgi:hypothetical protein
MKWIWVILLVIVGAFATYVAVEYLTVSIAHIPSWFPGHKVPAPGHRHARGHYRKGAAGAALVALIAFVGAGYLAFRNTRTSGPARAAAAPPDTSAASDASTVA